MPAGRRNHHKAEFQTCTKKKAEPWANNTKDLKVMVAKACMNRPYNRWHLHSFSPTDYTSGFWVRQKSEVRLDSAVNSTLKKESYLLHKAKMNFQTLGLSKWLWLLLQTQQQGWWHNSYNEWKSWRKICCHSEDQIKDRSRIHYTRPIWCSEEKDSVIPKAGTSRADQLELLGIATPRRTKEMDNPRHVDPNMQR